jgi:hypothetical protein
MKRGLLTFHQGWTDYLNCFALVSFYSKQYDILYLFCRHEMKEMVGFYCRNMKNIHLVYVSLDDINKRLEENINKLCVTESVKFDDLNIVIHGQFDRFRTDEFKGSYFKNPKNYKFYTAFYLCYDMPISFKISEFDLERDLELENKTYDELIGPKTDYICVHCPPTLSIPFKTSKETVYLHERTNIFFDFIKILSCSKELHLIDSSWAALVYLIQGKYNLCSDIPVFLYNKRNFGGMFQEPFKFKNWRFI